MNYNKQNGIKKLRIRMTKRQNQLIVFLDKLFE